jgi:hypothetical protein
MLALLKRLSLLNQVLKEIETTANISDKYTEPDTTQDSGLAELRRLEMQKILNTSGKESKRG